MTCCKLLLIETANFGKSNLLIPCLLFAVTGTLEIIAYAGDIRTAIFTIYCAFYIYKHLRPDEKHFFIGKKYCLSRNRIHDSTLKLCFLSFTEPLAIQVLKLQLITKLIFTLERILFTCWFLENNINLIYSSSPLRTNIKYCTNIKHKYLLFKQC